MEFEHKFFYQFLGEVGLGVKFVSPPISLIVDDNYKSIWLKLDTEKSMFSKNKKGGFSFPINRVSYGTSKDFNINLISTQFKKLLDKLKDFSLPLPN